MTGYGEGDSLRKGRLPGQRVKMRAFVRQEICRDVGTSDWAEEVCTESEKDPLQKEGDGTLSGGGG